MRAFISFLVLSLTTLLGCSTELDPCLDQVCEHPIPTRGKADTFGDPTPWTNWQRDILATALAVDLTSKTATARILLAASTSDGASFDVRGLDVTSVGNAGGALEHQIVQGRLDVNLPKVDPPQDDEVVVDFKLTEREGQQGLSAGGETFTWPYFCGNLFPCKSDPSDGLRFELSVSGVPQGRQVVFPTQIPADAPSYMLAWVTGDYTFRSLGKTTAGTEVGVWWRPGEESRALAGTDGMLQVFAWLEQNIGPYLFGQAVGSVSVRWGYGAAYGGMEHHPLWHVSDLSIDDFYIHAHEAAHGWFGDGVRLRCWEDFVLSEGTVSYLAARAMASAKGPQVEFEIWERFRQRLLRAVSSPSYGDGIAWPDTCNVVDIIEDNLYTSIPYMKGAFFYRAVEQELGTVALTGVISRFYQDSAGKAASMQEMLDLIRTEAVAIGGSDLAHKVDKLAQDWLRSTELPQLPDLPSAP